MPESLISLPSQPINIIVVASNGYTGREQMTVIATALKSLGLQNIKTLNGVGAITGTITSESVIPDMLKIAGIHKISRSRLSRHNEWSPEEDNV